MKKQRWGWSYAMVLLLSFFFFSCKQENLGTDNPDVARIPFHPLQSESDLDLLIQEIGDARVVLLGEASHGTAEYYEWRAAISRRLIQEKGFDFIAVEGEWADTYRVNQFVKGPRQDSAAAVSLLQRFDRWPTWMWRNYEVASLVGWMNDYNQGASSKAGFYGLDVYSLWESVTDILPYLQGAPDSLRQLAQQVQQCFQPYSADEQDYAFAAGNPSTGCGNLTRRLWQAVLHYTGEGPAQNEAHFVLQQNALVALNAERYYTAAAFSNNESWNIRDRHMAQTLDRLLQFHGPQSRGIVWEHNTHVGDARATDMEDEGLVNVGQLVRESYGANNVYLVGFGSYAGTVIAGSQWGAPMTEMNVPEARPGSWEAMLHSLGASDKLILSRELRAANLLGSPIGHRAIGVVYNPASESGNYVPSVIAERYDAFLFIDRTRALRPIR
jgi:erythromycin esterase-like protein